MAASTKPYERVKKASEIIFDEITRPLEEIDWQCCKAKEFLVDYVAVW